MSAIRVAYVDDEVVLCRMFARAARREGIDAFTFSDPREAVVAINEGGFDLVVSDFRMPGLTGLELLDQLTASVIFVLVSGEPGAEERAAADPRVAVTHPKPFHLPELLQLLEDLSARR